MAGLGRRRTGACGWLAHNPREPVTAWRQALAAGANRTASARDRRSRRARWLSIKGVCATGWYASTGLVVLRLERLGAAGTHDGGQL
jgi:hypothetical protein